MSASLPKTSYFKMVDVWLLFCIAIIFITIIFHAVIDYALQYELSPTRSATVKPLGNNDYAEPPKSDTFIYMLIMASRIIVLASFILFNIIYWSYILI